MNGEFFIAKIHSRISVDRNGDYNIEIPRVEIPIQFDGEDEKIMDVTPNVKSKIEDILRSSESLLFIDKKTVAIHQYQGSGCIVL